MRKQASQGLFDFIRYIEKLKKYTRISERHPGPGNMMMRCGS